MQLEDIRISKAIIDTFQEELREALESQVVVVGGGPSGLVAAARLVSKGIKTVLLERKLSVGGGMWGGGMMMNRVVFQEDAMNICSSFGIRCTEYEKGYYTANSVESVAALTLQAARLGVKLFNLTTVEDVMVKNDRVAGLVINWTAVEMACLHVDPIMIQCKFVLDATGHDAAVVRKLVSRMGNVLYTPSGKLEGEKPMWAARGEEQVVANTREAYPGLYVCGMAANATFGGQRMGPVFGGMLLSGYKAADLLLDRLANNGGA